MARPAPSPPPAYELLHQRGTDSHNQVHVSPPVTPSVVGGTEPQRVHELWFSDGNIVIQAGNSLYRVYRGALASRSFVFQDMLSLPRPPESELVEGCPFVELPDPAIEVTPFLRAIFEPEFFMPFPATTEFDAVVGCLRLSHKYGVDYLHRRALVHFSSGYPTTLSEMDVLERYWSDSPPPPLEVQSWELPDDPISRIRALQIAREVDAPWIIPRAFYTLSLNLDRLNVAIFHGALYKEEVDVRLSMEDQKSFVKGYQIQCSGTVADSLRFLWEPLDIQGCPDASQCDLARLKGIAYSREFVREYPGNFLYVWVQEDWGAGLPDMCPICVQALQKAHQDARQVFWDKLPEIYDLPEWEILEQLKTAALRPSSLR
ncbi:hypothetical protein K438DRAFT_1929823 [Mycena galopus ATCC 62051]|nr:hypothetical protein K438DRAFT_1929823 [Mycena galopus ATCC 62051]